MRTQDFDLFYETQWGSRWTALREALLREPVQVARRNLFSSDNSEGRAPFRQLGLSGCFEVTDPLRQEIPRGPEGLLQFYILDPASVWIANALDVQPGDDVLDMCAAPGGKTLILIEALSTSGHLLANEPSPGRRERLMKVIQQYVSREVRNRVRVTGKEGGLFSKSHPESFDRILVDAPCSGERHLLENREEREKWSSARTEKLAQTQYSLLSGALQALKPGGTLVYSTCSLSKVENDGVLRRLEKKKGDRFEFISLDLPEQAERTEFGAQFLPDRCGFGPLFATRLRKKA